MPYIIALHKGGKAINDPEPTQVSDRGFAGDFLCNHKEILYFPPLSKKS